MSAFLSPVEHIELVEGRLDRPALELAGRLDDPDTGSDLGPQRASGPAVVEAALRCAARESIAPGGWTSLTPSERGEALERFAGEIDLRADEIGAVEAVDTGVPVGVTRAIAGSLGDTLRGAVEVAREQGHRTVLPAGGRRVELLRLPWGPAALLAPWNAPAAVAVTKVANALAAGCPAILKPSEHAPQAAGVIARAAVAAGIPAGALQVVHGGADVAARLAEDERIRVVNLTGGATAGAAVARLAAPRMAALQLELGGSNPAIVTADADIDRAAEALAAGMTKLNGQWCEAPRRVFVEAGAHDALVAALEGELGSVRLGGARTPGTQVGPLAHRVHRDRVEAQVTALEGDVVAPVAVPSGDGLWFAPRLVLGLEAGAVRTELFAPVLTIHPVEDDEAALAAANGLGDGLAGYVFARDQDRAFALGRLLRVGEVRVGGTHLLDLALGSTQSFWGTSGVGGHGASLAFEAHRGSRVVGEDDPGLPI